MDELVGALRELDADPEIRYRPRRPGARFAAGADIGELAEASAIEPITRGVSSAGIRSGPSGRRSWPRFPASASAV